MIETKKKMSEQRCPQSSQTTSASVDAELQSTFQSDPNSEQVYDLSELVTRKDLIGIIHFSIQYSPIILIIHNMNNTII